MAAILWCALSDRLTPASWQVPVQYSGDALEVLTHLQAAAEWDVVPAFHDHVHRLGTPYGAEWSEYPAADDVLMFLLGQGSRLVGLGCAANLALLFASVTAVWSFYFCARYLRCPWDWAAVGAMLFAFSFYSASRSLAHFSVMVTATVPLALLSCWFVGASRRLQWNRLEGWICFGTALVLGISNPYNLFLYLQLMGWAVIAQVLRRGRRANLVVGLVSIGIAVGAFLIVNADVWLAVPDEGAAPLMTRNYGGTERYALKPIELFLPPNTHRFAPLAFLGERYVRWSEWRGEGFSAYLGVIGIVGLLWLLVELARRLLDGRSRPPAMALQAGWIFAFSCLGGFNNILAFFAGVQMFRATNRFSIFLLGLALMFLVLRTSRLVQTWSRGLRFGLLGGLLGLGLFDQIPRFTGPAQSADPAARFAADREFGAQLERRLPPNAMLFQLPYVEFPEARPIHRLADYELFRPYLHTRTLQFTYGALKGRARGRWAREFAALPPGQLISELEHAGFAAIYVNRLGYSDGGEALLAALASAGRRERLEGPLHEQVVVLLHPADHASPPVAHALTFGRGWNPRESRGSGPWRWAYGPAALAYFNPYHHPVRAVIRLRVAGQGKRDLKVSLNQRSLLTAQIGDAPQELPEQVVELESGLNRFDLDSDEPPTRVSLGPNRLRTFAVLDAQVELVDGSSGHPAETAN